jgi:hypothetical protein
MSKTIAILIAAAATASASADLYNVQIHGDVFFNGTTVGEMATVNAGETVTYSFNVDSDSTITGGFPTLGYEIDASSFSVSFSGGASFGLAAGFGPSYFVIRESDPVADGFFISQGPDFPSNLDLDEDGRFGPYNARFNVSYTGDTLTTLDIADAVGTYDFTGLTVFGTGIGDGFIDDVVGIDFSSMSISLVPAPSAMALLGLGGLVGARRRR